MQAEIPYGAGKDSSVMKSGDLQPWREVSRRTFAGALNLTVTWRVPKQGTRARAHISAGLPRVYALWQSEIVR